MLWNTTVENTNTPPTNNNVPIENTNTQDQDGTNETDKVGTSDWLTVTNFRSTESKASMWRMSYVPHMGARFPDKEKHRLTKKVFDPVEEEVAFPDIGDQAGAWLRLEVMDGDAARPFGQVLLLKREDWFDDSVGSFVMAFDHDGNILHQSEQINEAVEVQFKVHRFVER